jgi:hypothetical protein
MVAKLKVEGYKDLVREMNSNAIVNTNVSEYQIYMKRVRARQTHSDQIKDACREINNLKQELYEIKSLIKNMVNKNGS